MLKETGAELFLSELEFALQNNIALTGDAVTEKYDSDWTSTSKLKPVAVVQPTSTEEVAGVLRVATACHQHIVVQGGLTGLVGGATPQAKEVSLSLEKMNRIESVDADAMTITVEAGVTLEEVQNAASEVGLLFPLDLGARGSCMIGGNISTNAGGNQVIRYGPTRNLVLGLEAVLPDGTVVSSMNTLLKNNAGFDLKHLFIGSEGQLGVITRAVLRLCPQPKSRITMLCGMQSFEHTTTLLNGLRSQFSDTLNSFEAMWSSYYQMALKHVHQLNNPLDSSHQFYALVEICGNDPQHDQNQAEAFLEHLFEAGIVENAVVAQSEKQADDLWQIRDGIAQVIEAMNYPASFDIGLSLREMETFINAVLARLEADFEGIEVITFGHLGDGNIHITAGTGDKADNEQIYDTVYEMCRGYRSTISGEHGIGVLKKAYLDASRSDEEIQLMKQLKALFDPISILNSGRVI